ncbi:MAG TPA: transporter substrate-binding domain-containing protein [Candidatus Onthomonas avicola]|nr:transporter substrate-binding domain-containing protein [Candidatus Onthomonas avicola]
MKKLAALLLALAMCLALAACGGESAAETEETGTDAASGTEESAGDGADAAETEETDTGDAAAESDLAYVQDKGTLVVGITEFEPLDYQSETGEWIGFDAEMATGFAQSLGVEVQFQLIDWDNKIMELDGGTIDCVWNGMTLTDEVLSAMECSAPYLNNAQVVILPADVAADYDSVESLADLTFAVESGSAGQEQAEVNGFTYTEVMDQATALLEVSSGTADAAIIDSLMAAAMVGEGTSYEGLTYTISLNSEEYGVGFRKGSDLAAALDEYLDSAYADGTMQAIAEEYGVDAALIAR